MRSPPTNNQTVSLCIIVRNEERNLPICLKPMLGVVDETIVVDTGSVDRTKSIASTLGAKIFDFPWCDSFSAARNESIKHASGDWVLWLDADEHFDPENLDKLKRLLAELGGDNTAYFMRQVSQGASPGAQSVVEQVRLFRNRPDHRWSRRVHEQIEPALAATGAEFKQTALSIRHAGYVDDGLSLRKLERNLRLVQLDLHEQPDDAFSLFNLGSIYCGLNRPAEALPPLRRSLEKIGPGFIISPQIYLLISRCHLELGQADEALRWCLAGRKSIPHDGELLLLETDLRLAQQGGGKQLQSAWGESEAQLKLALVEDPKCLAAYERLGGIYLQSQRWADLAKNAQIMMRLGPLGAEEAAVQVGLMRMRQNLIEAAYVHFLGAARRLPQSKRIKELLAEVMRIRRPALVEAQVPVQPSGPDYR